MQNVSGSAQRLSLRRPLVSPELRLFMKLVKSPSHLMFIASNVALFVHLLFYSTVVRKQKMEEFISQINELENFEELIKDLDKQNEEIQKQISVYKHLQRKSKDYTDSRDSNRDQRPTKRSQSPIVLNESLHLHSTHANKFLDQRKLFATTFTEKTSIAKLFESSSLETSLETSHSTSSSASPTFSDPILNLLIALSHQFVKAFLVEINLRNSLDDKEVGIHIPGDSFLLHEDLFAYMNHDADKEELLTKLFTLRDVERTLPETFLSRLDDKVTEKLFIDFWLSDNFKNKGSRRYDIFHHISGQWLNYEHSDTFTSIRTLSSPVFASNTVSSDEYIRRFDSIFSAYELSKAPLREFALLLLLARALSTGGECIPSYSIFGFLLDKLGKYGLNNYQSMVYDVLPDVRYYQTSFADSLSENEFASRRYFHFAHLIGNNSDILASLMEYQVSRKDVQAFKLLVRLLEPIKVSNSRSYLLLPSFIRSHASTSATIFGDNQEVLIDLDTISRVIRGCVELKQYTTLDLMLSKLFLNLIQTSDGVRVMLSGIKDEKALIFESVPTLAPSLLLTESILLSLARAYTENRERTRSKWLVPHIDVFLTTHKSEKLAQYLPLLQEITMDHQPMKNMQARTRSISLNLPEDYGVKPQLTVSLMA